MPKELIFVLNQFSTGGAEKQAFWLAGELQQAGIHCRMLELTRGPESARMQGWLSEAAARGVEIHRADPGAGYLRGALHLRRTLRQCPHAWVWSWGHRADSLVWLNIATGGRRVWLTSLREANLESVQRNRWLWRVGGRRVTRVIANTELSCELFGHYNPRLINRCRVLYNAIEPAIPSSPLAATSAPSPLRLTMLGNLDSIKRVQKGYDVALDLMMRLRQAGVDVVLHIAGRANGDGWLDREVKARALESTIVYHGEVADPGAYLALGDVYLLFSRWEGTPNSLLEAMSAGIPSISTEVGDIPRLVRDGDELRLIPVGDIETAVRAIQSMISDWPGALAMGRRGQAWCERLFAPQVARARCLEIFAEIE